VVKQSTEVDESPAASPCYPPYRKFDVWMVEEWYAGCVWMVSMRLAFDNAASLFSTKDCLHGPRQVHRQDLQDISHDIHPQKGEGGAHPHCICQVRLAHGVASWREERLLLAPSSTRSSEFCNGRNGQPVRARSTVLVARESTNYETTYLLVPSVTSNCGLHCGWIVSAELGAPFGNWPRC
jgi:hypothetical protein